jgi:hypothetical protein
MATPLYIDIGLHYYTRAGEFDPQRMSAPAVKDALAAFVAHGMLERLDKPDEFGATYKPTDGLTVWCEALCKVNWPVRVWQIEGPTNQDAGAS